MLFNKRKHPRYRFDVSIDVRMNGKMIKGAECSNISLSGMCIVFEQPFDEGATGRVWLKRKYGKEEISFEGDFRSIWVKKIYVDKESRRMGVIFSGLVPEQRDNLYRIIQKEVAAAK